jgi:hypothetical protein
VGFSFDELQGSIPMRYAHKQKTSSAQGLKIFFVMPREGIFIASLFSFDEPSLLATSLP